MRGGMKNALQPNSCWLKFYVHFKFNVFNGSSLTSLTQAAAYYSINHNQQATSNKAQPPPKMKKASIKKIFKRNDKSPKTPTEEAWGELCTTKTPPKQFTPRLTPSTPQRSNLGGSSAGSSNHSRDSHEEYTLDRPISEGNSSMERLSSFSRYSSTNASSTPRNSISSRRSSRNGTSSGPHSGKRFHLEHYSSASAVDLDAPIDAYDGPIDLDESIHSASSSGSLGSHDNGHTDDNHHHDSKLRQGVEDRIRTSSPDTIPVVYEDGYDSDSWSGNNASYRHATRSMGLVDDASYTTGSLPPSLGDYPLAKRYTNDETMHVPPDDHDDDDDDNSDVYSLRVRSEEESIIAPMSTDELDGVGDVSAGTDLRELGFVRHETDESALDDEDYYKQDYFNMMTPSKRMLFEDRGKEEGLEEEEDVLPSLSERVLMSQEGGHGIVQRFSSQELMGMTEADLPEGVMFGKKPEDDDEGGDYGDFYTDVSFPVIQDENGEDVGDARRLDDEVDSEIREENDGSDRNGHEENEVLSSPQDRLDLAPIMFPAIMLPADNEFVDGSNDADIASNEPCSDPIQVEACVESTKCNEEEVLDIRTVLIEPIDVIEGENELTDETLAKADEVVIDESENICDENSTKEQLIAISQDDRGNSSREEQEAELDTDQCNEGGANEIIVVAEESNPVEVEQGDTEEAEQEGRDLVNGDSMNHFDEQIIEEELNCQEDNIIEANIQEEETENIQVPVQVPSDENDVSRESADCSCPISPLVRSNSFVDSPSHCNSSQAASPRRHSLGSMMMESQDHADSTRPSKTPHKEITDNLVVAGVMSLFMGGGRFAGKIMAKTPMKRYSGNTEDNQADDAKLSTKDESPGLYSIPSLASPLPTPLAKTAPAGATFDFKADSIATSPTIAASMQSQLPNDFDDTTDTIVEESAPELAVSTQCSTQQLSRSRSLSPSPKIQRTLSVDKPHVVERSMSLPVKWNPFPVSTLHLSSYESSELITIGSNNKTTEDMEETSDAITTQLETRLDENESDFPRLPLIAMNGQVTPNAPLSPTNSKTSVGSFSPGTTHDMQKIIRENQRLRIKRQQLCESLGSMAQQFAAHESTSAEKIFSLEQKIRALAAEKEHSVVVDKSGNYDAETVRRLSTGVLSQDKMLEAKDKQISQLTLRLEVLRRTLHDKEQNHKQSKKLWEEERMKFHNHVTSPEKKSFLSLKQELFESRMEVTRLKEALDNALSDIDALTAALESNNEALDNAVVELENLRKWKSEHNNDEVHVPTISRAMIPILSSSPLRANEHELRRQKTTELAELQKDLEHSLHELNELRELVVTHNRKDYRELEVEIQLLHDEAEASNLESKLAKQRIKQLSDDVDAKTKEMMQLRQELLVIEPARHQEEAPPAQEDVSVEKLPSSSPKSDHRSKDIIKDFFVVSDLVKKISELKQRLAEYEKSDEDNKNEDFKESKNEDTDTDVQSLPRSPSSEQVGVAESSSSKKVQPESPLTARRLFQPLRRGWANASPLIRNPVVDSPESRESSMKEKDLEIARLNDTVKANTEVMEKLKRDIINIQSEKEELEFDFTSKIEKLKEENLAFASQVAALEKAFMEMNDKRVSDGDEATDDGSTELPLSPPSKSEPFDTAQEEDEYLQSDHISLQRSIVELERTQSHQEDEIEHLKAELVKLRVTSQQEKDAALDQLREELAIVTAQRSALENQLIEINKSAGLLRNSLPDQASSSPNSKRHESAPDEPASPTCGLDGVAGGDPILVAQVVMLENANRVLESSVNSLRSDMQQKLAPLLEKIATLEEEKRIMEDEMNAKLECREMTITNLENSLQQLTSSRSAGSTKKKKHPKVN
eukprot:CCRYP_005750-RA/>CCRYP_005750-RA protein AED:0.00 eAED:0.00 QI:333/1/1/1/1/1/2/200/1845